MLDPVNSWYIWFSYLNLLTAICNCKFRTPQEARPPRPVFCLNFAVRNGLWQPWNWNCWVIFSFLQFGWGTKVYVWKRSGPSNVNLHRFCLTKRSTLTSQDHDLSSVVYRLGPSDGIYYPNFVPCFVVLYLNVYIWLTDYWATSWWVQFRRPVLSTLLRLLCSA